MKEPTQDHEEVKTTGHIYDEIEELDHAPPRWFTNLFIITVIFGFFYWLHYTLGTGASLHEDYLRAKATEEIDQFVLRTRDGGSKKLSSEQWAVLVKDDSQKKKGAVVFQSKCAACHGPQGQGGIGPNLTDRYWLHGGTMAQISEAIMKGVPEKGMPPWESLLSAEELQAVTVFTRTLQDTKPADAKAPQGELIKSE